MKNLYVISGPLGVGKTTVSKALSDSLEDSQLIVGDDLYNLSKEQQLEWEEKLQQAWERILSATKAALATHQNVVLDFVVEDELSWFVEELKEYSLSVKYIVLLADEKTIISRLSKRGELKYKERSLTLLNQLKNDPKNAGHILNTTGESVDVLVGKIVNGSSYLIDG